MVSQMSFQDADGLAMPGVRFTTSHSQPVAFGDRTGIPLQCTHGALYPIAHRTLHCRVLSHTCSTVLPEGLPSTEHLDFLWNRYLLDYRKEPGRNLIKNKTYAIK